MVPESKLTHIAALGVLSSRLVSLSPYVTVNTMLFIASFRLLKSVKTRVSLVYVCVSACPGLGSMADTLQQRHPAQRLEEACRRFSCNLFDIEEGHVGQMQRAPCTLRHSFCAIHFVPFTLRHSLCAINFAFHFD